MTIFHQGSPYSEDLKLHYREYSLYNIFLSLGTNFFFSHCSAKKFLEIWIFCVERNFHDSNLKNCIFNGIIPYFRSSSSSRQPQTSRSTSNSKRSYTAESLLSHGGSAIIPDLTSPSSSTNLNQQTQGSALALFLSSFSGKKIWKYAFKPDSQQILAWEI